MAFYLSDGTFLRSPPHWGTQVILGKLLKGVLLDKIIECRDIDVHIGSKIIISIDTDANVLSLRTSNIPSNCFDHSDYLRNRTDVLCYEPDETLLQNALADGIWE